MEGKAETDGSPRRSTADSRTRPGGTQTDEICGNVRLPCCKLPFAPIRPLINFLLARLSAPGSPRMTEVGPNGTCVNVTVLIKIPDLGEG